MNIPRRTTLARVSTVVVKVGTQLLSGKIGRMNAPFIASIAQQIARLRQDGLTVTLVSSGAIAAGMNELGLRKRPTDLAMLQAAAAVGQQRLMDYWRAAFAAHKIPVAQILVTRHDIDHRRQFLNLRNTLLAAHELGAIPVINENDTVSTDEITFGDNDILAASVAHALRADLLVLLTNVDGLLDARGHSVRCVESVDQVLKLVRADKSSVGKGGMNSKLIAAKMVTDAGQSMIVADGKTKSVILRLLAAQEIGTLFLPAPARRKSRASH